MTLTAAAVHRRMRRLSDVDRAAFALRFFKTGPGEYGEGDRFLGIRLPELHRVAREYQALPIDELERLLASPWHEERQVALFIMVRQYAGGTALTRDRLHRLYLRSTAFVNNWDLVDCSAGYMVGAHPEGGRRLLQRLARSQSLWERRIAIIATFYSIRRGRFVDTLAIARILLADREDLIHKAVGWMLREVGKRDRATLQRFLDANGTRMPRTMLRYAIERLPPAVRRRYLQTTKPASRAVH